MNNALTDGLKRFLSDEEGTETVEWALVAGLLVAGAAIVFGLIGDDVDRVMNLILTELQGIT